MTARERAPKPQDRQRCGERRAGAGPSPRSGRRGRLAYRTGASGASKVGPKVPRALSNGARRHPSRTPARSSAASRSWPKRDSPPQGWEERAQPTPSARAPGSFCAQKLRHYATRRLASPLLRGPCEGRGWQGGVGRSWVTRPGVNTGVNRPAVTRREIVRLGLHQRRLRPSCASRFPSAGRPNAPPTY
jgi:hypothetical protein